jgi:hypothetical protein
MANYFISDTGEVLKSDRPEDAKIAAEMGYLPASPEQIEDYEKTEKFSTGGQQLKTFGEGLAQSLTLGTSTWAEKQLGVDPKDIAAREEINSGLHLAGSLTGVAVPLVLSGGAAAPEIGAASSSTAALAQDAVRGAQAVSEFSAPSLIAHAGEGAAELAEHYLPEATTALGRVGVQAAKGAASAATEGALYGAGHVVHEAALGDPNLTAQSALEEVGLSALLGGAVGAGGGILSGLTREAAAGPIGKKLEEWAHNFEGNRNLKTAGAIQSDIKREAKKIGLEGVNQLGREGADLGLVGPFSTPAETLERSDALMESAGKKIGDILETADNSGWAKPKPIEPILSRFRSEVMTPLADNPLEAATAKKLEEIVAGEEQRFSSTVGRAQEDISFRDLHQLRKELSDKIYGLRGSADPEANALKSALHDFRSIVSDEIEKGLEKADLPGAALKDWKVANREYQVAATFNKFAEAGMGRSVGNNMIPLTSVLTGIGGAVMGGPVTATALGVGGYLAKRYGSSVLAAGARGMRNLIDEAGAESIVNKTAELIASERNAASNAAADAVAAHSSAMARAFDKAAEHLEPLVAPAKDATRHVLHENVEEKMAEHEAAHPIEHNASSAPEALAALSQLEAAQKRMAKHVDNLAHAVVTGKVPEHEASAAFAKSTDEFEKQMEEVRALAQNAEAATERVNQLTTDLHEHAPGVAQALALNASRALVHLNQKFPAPPKVAPLAPKLVPSQHDLFRYNKTREALEKPTSILKHAAAGTLMPLQVEAVRTAYPERLQQMQTAVLEKIAEQKGQVPYRQRLMLPILFGRDMDGTASPQAIAANQAVYMLPSQKSGQDSTGPGAVQPSQTGLSKLKLSNQLMTPGQAADTRRRGIA